jgi:hypothetical protein
MQNDWIWLISRVVKYQSLLGAMVGSFFAAFIAYRSIKIGFRNQTKLENDKVIKTEQKELLYYKGVLTTLYVNLQHHYLLIKMKKKEYDDILNKYTQSHILSITDYTKLPSPAILKKLLFRFIEYKDYDRNILSKLTYYFAVFDNLLEIINDFKSIPFDKEIDYGKEAIDCLSLVFVQIVMTLKVMEEIIEIIEKDPEIEKVKAFKIKDQGEFDKITIGGKELKVNIPKI